DVVDARVVLELVAELVRVGPRRAVDEVVGRARHLLDDVGARLGLDVGELREAARLDDDLRRVVLDGRRAAVAGPAPASAPAGGKGERARERERTAEEG